MNPAMFITLLPQLLAQADRGVELGEILAPILKRVNDGFMPTQEEVSAALRAADAAEASAASVRSERDAVRTQIRDGFSKWTDALKKLNEGQS